MSEWISVKERLPEKGLPEGRVQITVMACTKAKKVIIASRVFEFERKFEYNGVTKTYPAHWMWSRGMNSNITHWMPLPEPPKEELE